MNYEEVKRHYSDGNIMYHRFICENYREFGEYMEYYRSGQIAWHHFTINSRIYGEVKMFNDDGTLHQHHLRDDKSNTLATVVNQGQPAIHSEEQLIEIAKEHNLPLLSELPKSEAELTHWNLKYPDCPCLPIESE